MSDNDVVLRIPHALGAAEAKRRIASGVSDAKAQYSAFLKNAETEWSGDRMNFSLTALAQTVRGDIQVMEDHVELRAQLPTMIRMLAKRFFPAVENVGRKLLTK